MSGFLANPVWIILTIAFLITVVLAIVFWFQDVRERPVRTHPQTISERIWTVLSFPLMPILTLIVLAIPAIQAQTRLLLGQSLDFRVSKKT
jgi:heme/copper-type cytochrome/quinol oxidase subunit 2